VRRALLISGVAALAWLGVTPRAQQDRRPDTAVDVAPVSRPAGENPGVRGATYYALEGRTTRLTAEFRDGTRSVAVRGVDGDVVASLEGRDRNELNRVRVDLTEGRDDILELTVPLAPPRAMVLRADVHPTLDWVARQGHQWLLDGVDTTKGLQWRDGIARRPGRPSEAPELQTIRTLTTEWSGGLSAVTTPVRPGQGDHVAGRAVAGDVLVTKVMKDGLQVGLANYFTRERVFTWRIGSSEGSIGGEQLAARYGGWLFTPDMVWMNLQSIAFYEWRTAIEQERFVARARPRSGLERALQFIAPTLTANEPGCDGLHWIDGSVFRFCCDMHDRCYEKNGCASSSWWQVWSSWTCDICNGAVVFCFASGAGGPFYQYPW
jgi:hypothetical protein